MNGRPRLPFSKWMICLAVPVIVLAIRPRARARARAQSRSDGARARNRMGAAMMADAIFDHDGLDVYRLAIEYTSQSFMVAKDLSGVHRQARDQWLRASQSIPLNIAEGNGKRSAKDRARYFEIARGSAFECAAIQDVLLASDGLEADSNREMKIKLKRIVSMLTRMVMKTDAVSETPARYDAEIDYEHEHRCAEHEHEWRAEPEPSDATEGRWSVFPNGYSTPGPR